MRKLQGVSSLQHSSLSSRVVNLLMHSTWLAWNMFVSVVDNEILIEQALNDRDGTWVDPLFKDAGQFKGLPIPVDNEFVAAAMHAVPSSQRCRPAMTSSQAICL